MSPEEWGLLREQKAAMDRLSLMPPKSVFYLLREIKRHVEGSLLGPNGPNRHWRATRIMRQLEYILEGAEVQKGNENEIRPSNSGTTRNGQNYNPVENC